MPNILDVNGLEISTTEEISADLKAALKLIYGDDINVESESPDGQMVGIFSQADADVLDLLQEIYNMFSVESAFGVALQRIVAINGLTIKPGTFSTTPVDITADQALTLFGLDQEDVDPFQVQDTNTVWTLISTFSFVGAATQSLVFQADNFGTITPLPNTIITQATPTVGVTNVNNPTVVGAVIGQEEETDVALRIRQAQSFFLAATSPADSVEAALLEITDVLDALVVENRTGGVVDGVPAHSIQPIVRGGSDADIAAAIYAKAAPGVGLFGAVTFDVTRPNGELATMSWDVGVTQQFFCEFGIIPTTPGLTFDETLLKQQLAAALVDFWKLNQQGNIGDIVRAMFEIEPRAILISTKVSDDGATFVDNVSPTAAKFYFNLDVANIEILP